ncbi:MAG: alcohol dehydrogenase, partial [Syntrophomonadaceae bacterium]|nr:alcohol dehydrogenase [Syntrophomonadaceae bacterium]
AVEQWLFSVGATEKLADMGYTEAHIDKLVKLAFETPGLAGLLGVAPIKADETIVRKIFEESMQPMC